MGAPDGGARVGAATQATEFWPAQAGKEARGRRAAPSGGLETLNLSRAPIRSGALARLGALGLKHLSLDHCKNLDPGVFDALQEHRALETLSLNETRLMVDILR